MVSPELKKTLLTTLPFRYLDLHELEMLMNYCTVVTFSNGGMVCTQGKKNDGMYIIIEGKAFITAKILGEDVINLATLEQGNFIGEVGLIEKGPCPASVIPSGYLECLFLSTTYFDMLGLFFPETRFKISKAITEEVCNRLQNIHNQITELMTQADMVKRSLFSEVMKSLNTLEDSHFEDAHIDSKELQKSEFFSAFSQEEFNELLNYVTLIKAAKHSSLIKEGEKKSPYFVVLCGAVQLSVIKNNKVAKISVLGPMETFISTSYINDNEPSVITYTTCERAILVKITQENLTVLKKKNINLWYKIFNSICKSFVSLEKASNKLIIRLNSELYNR